MPSSAKEMSLVNRLADDVIEVPAVADYLQPIVSVIPLQLLAYHIAVAPRLRRRQTSKLGQERDRGVTGKAGKLRPIGSRLLFSLFCPL